MGSFKVIWQWAKWPVALALMAVLCWMNWEGLAQFRSRHVEWSYVGAAVILCTACSLLTFLRWYLLVWAQQFPFKFRDAVRLGFLGQFYGYFGPGILGGDLIKAVIVAKEQSSRRAAAAATVLLDRVLGLQSLFVLGALMTLFADGLPTGPKATLIKALLWGPAVCGLVGIGVTLIPGVTRWRIVQAVTHLPVVGRTLGELINSVVLYQSRPMVLVGSVLLGLVSHASLIAGFYCGVRAVEPWAPDLGQHFLFMPIAETLATFVPTPGNIGGLEGALQYFYAAMAPEGISATQAQNAGFIGAVVFRLVQLFISCVGYGYYLMARGELPKTAGLAPC